ncbi:hypothetical protein HK104_006113 [Borealophlyctis nickersoniae]|nr:hypothetical protein HK104_006113 [Borealophlyctis nickersoniae]
MDLHFQKKWAGQSCTKVWFPSTCFDDVATDFTIYTELGGKTEGFLYGTEYGCCGSAAVMMSFIVVDAEVEVARKSGVRWGTGLRAITAAFQVAIIVAVCAGLHIVSGPDAWDVQKTSLFVFLPCLFLNLASFVENFYETITILYA